MFQKALELISSSLMWTFWYMIYLLSVWIHNVSPIGGHILLWWENFISWWKYSVIWYISDVNIWCVQSWWAHSLAMWKPSSPPQTLSCQMHFRNFWLNHSEDQSQFELFQRMIVFRFCFHTGRTSKDWMAPYLQHFTSSRLRVATLRQHYTRIYENCTVGNKSHLKYSHIEI